MPDGVSVTQVSENGTELDVFSTGSRTSTLMVSSKVPLSSSVVTNRLSSCVLPPPAGNVSVFQPPFTEPFFDTQR